MSAKTITCYLLVCDGCGKNIDVDMDGGIRHFDSVEEAREEINEQWDDDPGRDPVSVGGQDLCGPCRLKPHEFVPVDRPYGVDDRCMRCCVERDEHEEVSA
ncbi:hypothetical protein [Dactylosporangium sp. CA-139066]|uniref:hypothetical protein n=1 Tax=Dactylosporangium sp. CA-139066 TaxID=3239930 RepID=UPI003D8A42F6